MTFYNIINIKDHETGKFEKKIAEGRIAKYFYTFICLSQIVPNSSLSFIMKVLRHSESKILITKSAFED